MAMVEMKIIKIIKRDVYNVTYDTDKVQTLI